MKQNKYGTWAVGAFMLLLSAAACTDSYESTPVDMFTEDYLFSKTDSNGTVVRKYLNRIYYYMRFTRGRQGNAFRNLGAWNL